MIVMDEYLIRTVLLMDSPVTVFRFLILGYCLDIHPHRVAFRSVGYDGR